jgi:hypothetical protein
MSEPLKVLIVLIPGVDRDCGISGALPRILRTSNELGRISLIELPWLALEICGQSYRVFRTKKMYLIR